MKKAANPESPRLTASHHVGAIIPEPTKIDLIKAHFLAGKSLTGWQAIKLFNCMRLAAVVYELKRNHGLNIVTDIVSDRGTHFASYRLAGGAK